MKKPFNICRNVFAVIGVIATLLVILFICCKPYFEMDVYPSRLAQLDSYVDTLRASGHYVKDTTNFRIQIVQDSV